MRLDADKVKAAAAAAAAAAAGREHTKVAAAAGAAAAPTTTTTTRGTLRNKQQDINRYSIWETKSMTGNCLVLIL